MPYSLNSSLLDYEGPELSVSGFSERGDSILNDMSGTPSFRSNGVDAEVSMGINGITPMRHGSNNNNGAEEEAARREMEKACVDLGKAYRNLKMASFKLGMRVPPTPVHKSTPRWATTTGEGTRPLLSDLTPIRAPISIGGCPVGGWRLTPGGENRPFLPMGLTGTETVQDGKVWIDFSKPPPGYTTKSPATVATTTSTMAAASVTAATTAAAAARVATTTTAAAQTTTSSSAAASASEWRSGREQRRTGKWQGGKGLRMKLNRRKEENSERQRRKLGGRCARCFGEHTTPECHLNPEELRCTYPPCRYKTGHVTAVCYELSKICVLPVCNKAIGHRSFCHKTIPVEGGEPYGYSEEAARRLREEFSKFSHYLTDEDWENLALVNTSGEGAGGSGGGRVRRERGVYGRDGGY